MILFPVYHSIYKLYSKNRTFVLFFCKNKAQDNILSHALLCYALPFILHCLFYTILFTIASASASSSAFWSACIADLMVSPVSRIVISFISLIFSLTCFAAVGAQVFHNCNGFFLNSQGLDIGKQIFYNRINSGIVSRCRKYQMACTENFTDQLGNVRI